MYPSVCLEHRTICAQADAIVEMVSNGTCRSGPEIAARRLEFCKSVRAHCDAEAEQIRAMAPAIRARHPDLFRKFEEELQAWRQALAAFNSHWPLSRLTQDPTGFAAGFGELTDALHARVRWEEQHFYPSVSDARPAMHPAA